MFLLEKTGFKFIIFIFYIQNILCQNVNNEYFLQEGSLGHCGQNIVNKASVIVRSHVGAGLFGGLNTYQAGQQCAVTFQAENGQKILVHFTFFEMQPPEDNTCKDKIIITEMGTGSYQVTEFCIKHDYVSVTEKIEIKFISDAVQVKKGFVATVTGFREGTCTNTEFKCDTNRCISNDLKCDGLQQCIDGSDENKELAQCSFFEKVIGEETALGNHTVLAISVVICGVMLTIFLTAIFWEYLKKERQCCKFSSDDHEDDAMDIPPLPLVDVRKGRAAPPGNVSRKQSSRSSVDKVEERNKAAKNTEKRKVQNDDEW